MGSKKLSVLARRFKNVSVLSPPESATQSCAAAQRWPTLVFAHDDSTGSGKRGQQPSRILVVEDDFLVASQVEMALSDAGFAVAGVAASAEEAVEMARSHAPALAVMDVRLAGERDGIQAALEIFGQLGIRCIFATAHSDQLSRDRAKPAMPLGWLQKPYTMISLVNAVRQALKELDGNG